MYLTNGTCALLLRRNQGMNTRERLTISSFPNPFPGNPYLGLLYSHLKTEGVNYVQSGHFGQQWLRENRGIVDFIHFHWIGGFYEDPKGRISFSRLVLFVGKLWMARALGYRTIWTIHNLYPHNRPRNIMAWVCRFLCIHSFSIVLLNFESARDDISRIFLRRRRVFVLPHGNYRPVYPHLPQKNVAREAVGIAQSSYVFFLFGGISPYKGGHKAIKALGSLVSPDARLVIMGQCLDAAYRRQLTQLAAEDRRVDARLGTEDVPDSVVCEWMAAIDCILAPYDDIYTSGVLYLAATFGKPVIAPRIGVYATLADDFLFLYEPADTDSQLPLCMQKAMCADTKFIARSSSRFADAHEWSDIARRLTNVLGTEKFGITADGP